MIKIKIVAIVIILIATIFVSACSQDSYDLPGGGVYDKSSNFVMLNTPPEVSDSTLRLAIELAIHYRNQDKDLRTYRSMLRK